MYINVAQFFPTLFSTPDSAGINDIYRSIATKMQSFIKKTVFTTSKE
jgi:hypothetical protein